MLENTPALDHRIEGQLLNWTSCIQPEIIPRNRQKYLSVLCAEVFGNFGNFGNFLPKIVLKTVFWVDFGIKKKFGPALHTVLEISHFGSATV